MKTKISLILNGLVCGAVLYWIHSMSPCEVVPVPIPYFAPAPTPVKVEPFVIERVLPSIASGFKSDFSGQKICNAYQIYKISLVSESRFDEKLSGVLSNKGATFRKVGRDNRIDPLFLASIAIHESGNGTSNLAKKRNNVCGIYDSKNKEYQSFKNVDECIDFTGKLLANYVSKQLDTVERVQRVYCPIGADNDPQKLNGLWLEGVQNWMTRISGNDLILYSNP